ncbi:MAG: YdcF family protein [Campylobacterales bacterium]|nr:YdcF family protein [Campylobacterales bacterium]
MFNLKYKKIFITFIIVTLIFLGIKNLGYFFDVSTEPKYADVIVSLGGDNGTRIKKTLSIYENNMSKSGKLIITGVDDFDPAMKLYELDWRASYLEKKGIKIDNIVFNSQALNTLEEILFIKKYMIENNMHSVIFITDAPHSRRISFFASEVANYEDENLSYIVVATENDWWDRDRYYTNPEAIIFVVNECIKLTYYYIQNILGNLHAK